MIHEPGTELNQMGAVPQSHIYSAQIQPCLLGLPQPSCGADRKIKAAINLLVVTAVLYFIATFGILFWKLRSFRSLPYAQVQVSVVFYRLQVSRPWVDSFTASFCKSDKDTICCDYTTWMPTVQ